MTLFLFCLGLVALTFGADILVRGATGLARRLGISSLIIGLTVVAFGTSAPELAVSINAAFKDQADIALGNVIGSNICNILLILGLCALILPLAVNKQLIKFDIPVMIIVSLVAYVLAIDGRVSRLDGALLAAAIFGYLGWLLIKWKVPLPEIDSSEKSPPSNSGKLFPLLKDVFLVAVGLGLLVLGSDWLVEGAVTFARYLGVGELVIGLTVVAVGTSLPEIATSVMASIKGQRDIALGNVIGSNIFNLLSVLGISALVAPSGIPVSAVILSSEFPIMIAVALITLPICFSGLRISRFEGGMLFALYLLYTGYLILGANGTPIAAQFNLITLYYVLPVVAVLVIVPAMLSWFKRAHPSDY